MKHKKPLVFLIGLLWLLLACGIPGLEDGAINLDIEIDEAQFEELLLNSNFTINGEAVFDKVTAVDFMKGTIHIEGIRDGQAGFIDMGLFAENNQLKAEIKDYDFAGIDADVAQLNELLATSLTGATDQTGNFEVTRVEVTEDAIVMKLRVQVVQE